ncbi:MAG: flavodoxin domain-containing protein [Kofleriaceae bacterium]|nr:flavodoxin domain-containing protein [Kofleriaceae bacterium]
MSDILILYASHYGQTRTIAERIGSRLREHGHDVDVVDVQAKSARPIARGYDLVVLGSRIEFGKHAREVLKFVRANREDLRAIPTAFFSVSMSASNTGGQGDPGGYVEKMFSLLGWRPTVWTAFPGALPYRTYGAVMRFVMKQISRAAGHTIDTSRNHVFTSDGDVDAFAYRLARLLLPKSGSTIASV